MVAVFSQLVKYDTDVFKFTALSPKLLCAISIFFFFFFGYALSGPVMIMLLLRRKRQDRMN
jgi:hypothetical protein